MISRLRSSPPASPRPVSWLLAGFGAAVVVLLALRYAGTTEAAGLDATLMRALFSPPEPLYQLSLLIDFSSEPVGAVLVVTVLVAVLAKLGRFRTAVALVAGVGVAAGLTTGLKPLLGRTIYGDNLSFPSGHTAFAVVVGVTLTLAVAGRTLLGAVLLVVAALVAGGAMAWAQVALGAHYPTDTLGGFGVGLTVALLVPPAVDRLLDRPQVVPAS